MDDYISRQKVERFIENGLNNPDKSKAFGHDAVEILTEVHFMDAVDVRPVVYCVECEYWNRDHVSCEGLARCLTGETGVRYRNERDFCSRGAKMGGKQNG